MSATNPAFLIYSDLLEKRINNLVAGMDPDSIPDKEWYEILFLVASVRDYVAISKACVEHSSKENV